MGIRGIVLFLLVTALVPASVRASDCSRLLESQLTVVTGLETNNLNTLLAKAQDEILPNFKFAHDHPGRAFVEVSKLSGLKHTFVAAFNSSVFMNWALARVAIYQDRSRIITLQNLTRRNSPAQNYAGFSMPASLLREFRSAMKHGDSIEISSAKTAAAQIEIEFWSRVIDPLLAANPELNLIAVGVDHRPMPTLDHEIWHAHFYESAEVRAAVKTFWQSEVTSEDRDAYVSTLRKAKYDITNQDELINEFFAYTLEDDNGGIFSPKLVARYRDHLVNLVRNLLSP